MLDRRELGLAGKTPDFVPLTLHPTTTSSMAHLRQIKAFPGHLRPGEELLEVAAAVVAHTQRADGSAQDSQLLLQLFASGWVMMSFHAR